MLGTQGKALLLMNNKLLQASSSADESEEFIDVSSFLRVLWKRAWVLVMAIIVIEGITLGIALAQTPQYQASMGILIGQRSGEAQVVTPTELQGLTVTMAKLVETRSIATAVIRQVGLETTPEALLRRMDAEPITDTQIIEVTYTDPSPTRAHVAVNAAGEVFSAQVSEVSPRVNAVSATVWDRAAVPNLPVSPRPKIWGVLGLILGAVVGMILVFVLEALGNRRRSPEEVEQILGIPTFGTVRAFKPTKLDKENTSV
jgi:capsular polysaccharide biosynthesis protein